VRLHKYLAECGVASRRGSEDLIRAGQVMVNGKRVTQLGLSIDPLKDQIRVGRRFVKRAVRGVLLFHKPRGVVSTRSDPQGRPAVSDYLPARWKGYFPAGRLDFDSSGLLVLTNDGDLGERLLHPRYGMRRVYEVQVRGFLSEETCRKLAGGVELEDGSSAAKVRVYKRDQRLTRMEIVVAEGRNRLVRRMMEAVGHPVVKLKRVAHGPFRLGGLRPGELKALTEREYLKVRELIMEEKRRGRSPSSQVRR
jgi:23S rRNA pseudouridine2605 synthase